MLINEFLEEVFESLAAKHEPDVLCVDCVRIDDEPPEFLFCRFNYFFIVIGRILR